MKDDVMADTWSMVREERSDMLSFCETLSEEQWNASSLCTQWRVRDVIGHMIGEVEFRMSPSLVLQMVRCGFNVNKLISRDAIDRGNASIGELLRGLEGAVANQSLPPGVKQPEGMLMDALLHHQDIRRPLGAPRTIPSARLLAVLEQLEGYKSSAVNAVRRIKGLRLVATDLDWSSGNGPEVSGPAEALAMVMGGRCDGLKDLSGEGKSTLASRV